MIESLTDHKNVLSLLETAIKIPYHQLIGKLLHLETRKIEQSQR